MSSIDQAVLDGGTSATGRNWYLATLLMLVLVLLYHLGAQPLAVWDEARLANNAIEMAQSGLSFVTTYAGLPDHWNTKPPLLIWLMALSIRCFGMNEWAVRLPSALAAIAVGSLVFWFCAVRLKRPVTGFIANLFLLATPGFVISHGARSGDYDSMLTLWTTACLLAGYLYVHDRKHRQGWWLVACCLSIVLAFLTKTIQGLVFLPALVFYVVLQGQLFSTLRSRKFYISVALIVLTCAGYYFLRDQADPGYWAAARSNDLGGRYATVIENHQESLYWYLFNFRLFPWIIPGLLAGVAVCFTGNDEQRKISFYISLSALFYLVMISTAATKLWWYAIPLSPLLAVLLGMAIDIAVTALGSRLRSGAANWSRITIAGCVALGICVVAYNMVKVDHRSQTMAADEIDQYSVFLRSDLFAATPKGEMVIIHPGYPNGQADSFYVAPPMFYMTALRAAGHAVTIQPESDAIPENADTLVVCDDARLKRVTAGVSVRAIARRGQCGVYLITDHHHGILPEKI